MTRYLTEPAEAAALLARGELVALPTETVYGLAADARDPVALAAIFAAKERPSQHPLIVHLSCVDELTEWVSHVPESAHLLAAQCWPGPLTLLLKRHPSVSDVVTGGRDTVAVRLSAQPLFAATLNALGRAVAAPSANRHKRISPTCAADVIAELDGRIAGVLDGGPCEWGLESTIIDLTGPPTVLRPGPVTVNALAAILGQSVAQPGQHNVAVPGNMRAHYQPRAAVRIVDGDELATLRLDGHVAVMPLSQPLGHWPALPMEPVAYGKLLYRRLRDLDGPEVDTIVVESPPTTAPWQAVWDRLARAAAG
ncbi:L-threonylcarbamoyladenylate synthase [Gallaecimonas sp. GXIMD1310]|uniref:L-threonylcarbamoyladenylate synthase n=1 Tax=Gallaecimonas sp. GXIMD1310 TaxID=3131926 RepID=UPI003245F4A0